MSSIVSRSEPNLGWGGGGCPSTSGNDDSTYTEELFVVYLKVKFHWASYTLSGTPVYGPHLHARFLTVTDGRSPSRSQSSVLSRKRQESFSFWRDVAFYSGMEVLLGGFWLCFIMWNLLMWVCLLQGSLEHGEFDLS